MKSEGKTKPFNKTILSAAVSTALSVGLGLGCMTTAQADIYEFSYTGLFTMLDPGGTQLQNTSYPYYGDPTWGYGLRTQISGTMTFDTMTGAGSGTVNPFEFFNGGPAVASGVFFQSLATPTDPANPLMLGNMTFSWNSSDISTQIVLDGSGLFAAIGSGAAASGSPTFDATSCTGGALDGLCALPASDGIKKGKYPIGPIPIATSSYNTAGQTGFGTTLGQLSLGTDDGIGGSPMDNGPFSGYNANFDMASVTVTSFTDMTPPVITMNGSSPVIVTLNDPYSELGATCTDAAPLNTNLDSSVVIAGDTVNTSNGGIYTVTYDCQDASTIDAAQVTRTVLVAESGPPLIAFKGSSPATQECAVPYVDAGAVCADYDDGEIPIGGDTSLGTSFDIDQSNVDNNIGTPGSFQSVASCTDSDTNLTTSTRIVNIVDTTPPAIVITGGDKNLVSLTPENGQTYTDEGASVTDSCDLTLSAVTTTGDVIDLTVPDTGNETLVYKVKYEATDADMNTATVERTVSVTRSQPVITLLNEAGDPVQAGNIIIKTNTPYTEYGMNIHDAQDGDVSDITTSGSDSGTGIDYTVSGAVDVTTPGDYLVTYTATDSDGNKATDVVRTVTVGDKGIGNFTMLDPSGVGVGGTNDVTYAWDGTVNDHTIDTPDSDGYIVPSDMTPVMTISSPEPFSGFNWDAKNVRVYRGPAKLKFDVTCREADTSATPPKTVCGNPLAEQKADQQYIKLDLAPGEIGAHMTFDWGKDDPSTPCGRANCDIDVVLRWEEDGVWNSNGGKLLLDPPYLLVDDEGNLAPPAEDTVWKLVSTDVPENGVPLAENGVGDGFNGRPMIDGPFNGFHANFNLGPGSAGVQQEKVVSTISDVEVDKIAFSMGLWPLLAGLFSVFGLRQINNKK